jgi:hypothetical protein
MRNLKFNEPERFINGPRLKLDNRAYSNRNSRNVS